MRDSELRFIRQQGVTTPDPDRNLYQALMLQPRIVGTVALVGVVLQSPWPFLVLSAALWWSTLVPAHSLFDAIYNVAVARPRSLPRLGAAPAPRRFAQAMAALFALVIAVALIEDARVTAGIFEVLFAAGVIAAVFRDFCGAAQLYTTLTRMFQRRSSPHSIAS